MTNKKTREESNWISIVIAISIIVVVLFWLWYVLFGSSPRSLLQWFTPNKKRELPTIRLPIDTEKMPTSTYVWSLYKGNYIRGGAMNLAWNELVDNIVGEPIRLQTTPEGERIMHIFNAGYFTKKDLDEESYYVKSGFWAETVETINKESKEKFPEKSFSDIPTSQFWENDIISYAYFFKNLKYKEKFEESSFIFNSTDKIKSITPTKYSIVKNIKYRNDDMFIVQIELENKDDELYLAKGFDMSAPDKVVTALQTQLESTKRESLKSNRAYDDYFNAPMISLSMEREYRELLGAEILNTINKTNDYVIKMMKEKIHFDMDEVGVKVENEAIIWALAASIGIDEKTVRNFILDKPYWIIMKKVDSNNPYFILGVNNTEIMKKVE